MADFVVCSPVEVTMNGLIEPEIVLKTLPTIINGSVKLFEFGKTRKELAATRKELAVKGEKLNATLQELDQCTKAVVAATEELVETRDKLADVLVEYDDYRDKMELILWGAGATIAVLVVIVVVMAVKQG
jgi:hypothetical protein